MEYEKLITKPYGNTEIEYGVFLGNSTVLFIKAGYQGNIYGYQNKYLQMASHIHQKYGITTVVSSNPFNGENPLDIDMSVINELTNNQVSEIYYMGHSNGAIIGACWGCQYPLIKKMLLINPPMMMNCAHSNLF